jgi:hypothetical protein
MMGGILEGAAAALSPELDERSRELAALHHRLLARNPSLSERLPQRFSEGLREKYRNHFQSETDRLQEVSNAYWAQRRRQDPFAGMMRPTPKHAGSNDAATTKPLSLSTLPSGSFTSNRGRSFATP